MIRPKSHSILAALAGIFVASAAYPQAYSISTFAGGGLPINIPAASAGLYGPMALAVDKNGNIYFCDLFAVLRLDGTTGILTLVAGNGSASCSGDNGPATAAGLNHPTGIAVDSSGNVYIADTSNNRVRKVSGGVITTVAGNGFSGFSGDGGPASSAELNNPSGLAVDAAGNLYIADSGNNRVREVSGGVISTFAGDGAPGPFGDGGPATSASLYLQGYGSGLAVDLSGSIYICDPGDDSIRKVANGIITTVAGGTKGFSGDNGPATSASLNLQFYGVGVAVDAAGELFIGDTGNQRIRKVSGGVITTIAGNGTTGFGGDGGQASGAELNLPLGVAVDPAGSLYVADNQNYRIRKVSGGTIATIAGNGLLGFGGDNGAASGAVLNNPSGVAVDSAGNVYIADTANNAIRKVSKGIVTTIAGNGTPGFSGDGGPATSAQLNQPYGVAVDASGNVYIADSLNYRIRKISGGVIATVAGTGSTLIGGRSGSAATAVSFEWPLAVAVDSSGNFYVADAGFDAIWKVSDGVATVVAGLLFGQGFFGDNGPATSAGLHTPSGIAIDSSGNLYIADTGNNRIRKVTNGIITTIAGNGSVSATTCANGSATSVAIGSPDGIAVDSAGNLYVADSYRRCVREISNGQTVTIAGNGYPGFEGDNGPALNAELNLSYSPIPPATSAIALDSSGNVYIADSRNNRIRELTLSTVPSITPNGIVPNDSSVPVIQPGSWVSIYGSNLATGTSTWNADFPTSLGGVTVTLDGKPAYLWFVSPTQINLQVPDDATTGLVSVVVNTSAGTGTSTVTLAAYGPSFSLLGDGKHVAGEIATLNGAGAYGGGAYDLVGPSGAFSFNTRPVKPGEVLVLFGVGFGPTTPHVPAGQVYSGTAPTNSPVTVTIGGAVANVAFSGITEAGLYQFNLTVPANAASGDQPLLATVNGVQTPSGPVVTIQ